MRVSEVYPNEVWLIRGNTKTLIWYYRLSMGQLCRNALPMTSGIVNYDSIKDGNFIGSVYYKELRTLY